MVASLLYTGTRIDRRGAAGNTVSAGRLSIGASLGWQVILLQRRGRLSEESELLTHLIADAGEIHAGHRPRDVNPLLHIGTARVDGERMTPARGGVDRASMPQPCVEEEDRARAGDHATAAPVELFFAWHVGLFLRPGQKPRGTVVLREVVEKNRCAHVRDVARNDSRTVDVDTDRVVATAGWHRRGRVGVDDPLLTEHGAERSDQSIVVEQIEEASAVQRAQH